MKNMSNSIVARTIIETTAHLLWTSSCVKKEMMYSTNAVNENRKGSDTLNPSDIDDSLTSKQRIPFTAIDAVERYTDNSETSDIKYLKTK